MATTHGHCSDGKNSATYKSWNDMKRRCISGKYSSRGITFCSRWESFENFLSYMGEKPHGMTLDRIDNDGNYEPSNCRWATPLQQSQNTSKVKLIECNGESLCLREWSRRLNWNFSTLWSFVKRGGTISQAMEMKK